MSNKIEVSQKEYREKRYDITKEILTNILTYDRVDRISDIKQRKSLIFQCMQFADILLSELGYSQKSNTVRNLSSILADSEGDDS